MRQLGQLQSIKEELERIGYQIIAVSADVPADARKTGDRRGFTFVLISDQNMIGSRALGIAWQNPRNKQVLPVPGVFILDQEGKIKFEYINPDHRVRLDNKVLISEAKAALK
jgi:peroxiredoxin